MLYQIGDKVQLKNGTIIIIEEILNTNPQAYCYGYPTKICLSENDIVMKIED